MKQKPNQPLDLRNDRFFRRFFSTSKPVLFSLIKSFLPISDEALSQSTVNPGIVDTASATANQQNPFDDLLYLQDSSIAPATADGKQVMLDLRVKLRSGENVGIEMQNYAEKNFITRMMIYWSRLHSQQPERGQGYAEVKPSYLLAFTNFSVSDSPNPIHKLIIVSDEDRGQQASADFTMVIVQLNKFNKSLHELVALADRWCYIIKYLAELTAKKVKYLLQDGETKMILEHLAEISKENREYWEAQYEFKREWEDQLRKEELEERARVQGMEEGRVQGMQAGKVERDREIALSMLQKGLEVSLISEVTGLSVAEIEQLNHRTAD